MNRLRGRCAVVAASAVFLTLVWTSKPVAAPQFLQVDHIKGEASDANHEGWIKIETVTISPAGPSATGRVGAPATGPGTLTVTRAPDSSSLPLAESCRAGDELGEVALDMRTESTGDFIAYVLSDVVILECDQETSGERRIETITFEYQRLGFQPVRPAPPPIPPQSVGPQS